MDLGENAAYLTEPPDSAQCMPPVPSTSLQLLPFAHLTPPNLERLCVRIGEKEGEVEYAGIYGVSGQNQDGIDVLVRRPDGKYRLIQSRRIKEVTPSGVAKAVDDFLDGDWAKRASSFVYATSASATRTELQDEIRKQADRLAEKGIDFDAWDEDRFSRKLKDHPDLVIDFFGADVLRAFLPEQTGPVLAEQLVHDLTPQLALVVRDELHGAGIGAAAPSMPEVAEGLLDMVLVPGELAPDIREILDDLRGASKTEAAHLASYVRDDARRACDLIRDPQPWVERGSWQLHNALGMLANAAGSFPDAERAFLAAQGKSPAPKRALLLMCARDAAENDERPEEAAQHFERARELDHHLVAVRIVEIQQLDDLQARIYALDALAPANDRERSSVDRARIDILLELDHLDEALERLEEMLVRTPDSVFALDRRAGLAFCRGVETASTRHARDPAALREAADDSLNLRDRVRPRGRTREAGRLLSRAAECLVLAGERDQASKVLERVSADELAHDEVRTAVAQALLHAGGNNAALATLGEETRWTDNDRLVAAHALALTDDHHHHERATELARPLLADDAHAASAALAITAAAAFDIEIPWPEDAAGVLAEASPVAAAHFRAERLTGEGREDEAERLLQKHADDPNILRALVERNLDARNWNRGLALAERLFRDTGSGEDRMLLARALKGGGKLDRLKQELNALAGDATQPSRVRARAYAALSAELPPEDFAALDEFTERWLRDVPEDLEAQWQRTYVLARLARYEQALKLVTEHCLEAQTVNQAHLMAATFTRALPPLEAARRIATLSDQFDRQDEGLEALLLFTATRTKEDADQQLRARLGETFRTFHERFPDSTAVKSFTVDEDNPESILDVIRSQFDPQRERQRRDILDQLTHGNAALAYLGATISRHIPQIIQRILQIPMAYGDSLEWERELGFARGALGGPAVWDPASLTIVASMPECVRNAAVAALPGSVLAYSSLQECDEADAALDDRDEEETISVDGEGFRITVMGSEALSRERDVVKRALALARDELIAVPNVAPDEPDDLDEFFRREDRQTPFDTFPATFSVAGRRGLPLYSDDRYVRRMAHRERIETFGSLPLLAAMVERRDLDADAVAEFRLDLLRRGAVGLRPTGNELAVLADEHDDQPAGGWLPAIIDPCGWRNDPDEHLRQCVIFLRHVWQRRPELLADWAARVLDCAGREWPRDERFFASTALVYLWFIIDGFDDNTTQRAFSLVLINAFVDAAAKLGLPPFDHIVDEAILNALAYGAKRNPEMARWMLITIVRQLRFPLDAQVLMAYWDRL